MVVEQLILLRQELALAVIIFVLLFPKLGKDRANTSILNLVNVLLFLNFAGGLCWPREGVLFNHMFSTGAVQELEKNMLNLAAWLISMQSYAWLRSHKHVTEFYMLMLTSLMGMFFMISAGNMLMFYLGLEMSAIPLAALANFDLGKKRSSEAAMKMIFSSAFSSALFLLGASFLYGITGTLDFTELAARIHPGPLITLSFVLLFSGFAFKASAVPFHLWTADVYEGSPVAVTSFLSVVSKTSVLFVLMPFLMRVCHAIEASWYPLVVIVALATIITGNLFALRQNNLKRFLAFSSVSQVGFVLLAVSSGAAAGVASVIYFLLIYIFSNLAAFGVVSLISATTGVEDLNGYRGLYRSNPFLAWTLTIALFSLAGVPPAAGFFGKFFLLLSAASKGHYWIIVIAALNMVVSFYYYLRVVKAMFMDNEGEAMQPVAIPRPVAIALWVCLAGVLVTGLLGVVYDHIFSLIG